MKIKIQTPNGKITKATLDAVKELLSLDAQIAELSAKSSGLKEKLKEGIESANLGSIKGEDFNITYKNATTTAGIDTKTLKAEAPEIFKKYMKTGSRKSSISVKGVKAS